MFNSNVTFFVNPAFYPREIINHIALFLSENPNFYNSQWYVKKYQKFGSFINWNFHSNSPEFQKIGYLQLRPGANRFFAEICHPNPPRKKYSFLIPFFLSSFADFINNVPDTHLDFSTINLLL